ncbi:mitochondrial carnitine/acylcarnitine carrier protein-like isoform X2 [Hyla sarda]|uniref:mitochondrial carnitine/acylcarnitine carrier protein-like isoform X2 n=1 Tax=Hyla sarda TaxID=327740 RepID=UPI0024C42DCB|nr:mitochondrial carnitine/acylcarnitine carrier protein-like isoform X2 [Hyla sarda]
MSPENGGRPLAYVKHFVSGGMGGVCLTLAGQPMDTVKVNLQIQARPMGGQVLQYNNTVDCFRKIVSQQGLRGLYKGMGAPLAGVTPIMAMTFLGFSLGKKLQQNHPHDVLRPHQVFSAGMLSGLCAAIIVVPAERIKCLLQAQANTSPKRFSGPIDCARQLFREQGLRSLYRGTVLTLLRDIPATGMYFMSYEWMKEKMAPRTGRVSDLSAARILLAGGVAGVCNWAVAIPMDVLKSRFQTAPDSRYRGVLDVFREVLRDEGPRGLYKGFTAAMIRAFPANAACFLGFEASMKFLHWLIPDV